MHFGLDMTQQRAGRDIFHASWQVRAGIADDNIHAAERRDHLIDKPRDLRRLTHIAAETAGARNPGGGGSEFCFVAAGDRHLAAFGRQLRRNGEADAAAAAGDQSYFVAEPEVHDAYPNT